MDLFIIEVENFNILKLFPFVDLNKEFWSSTLSWNREILYKGGEKCSWMRIENKALFENNRIKPDETGDNEKYNGIVWTKNLMETYYGDPTGKKIFVEDGSKNFEKALNINSFLDIQNVNVHLITTSTDSNLYNSDSAMDVNIADNTIIIINHTIDGVRNKPFELKNNLILGNNVLLLSNSDEGDS